MRENNFKRGDRVRVVDGVAGYLTNGDEYTVAEVAGKNVVIDGPYDNGDRPEGGMAWSRFELVTPPAAAKDANPMILPTDPEVRKGMPITTGVLDYFPLALAEVARLSKIGNDQHNPGQPLHWDKTKSLDHADTIARHLIDRGRLDSDGARHSAKLAWRALALLQTELEAERAEQA